MGRIEKSGDRVRMAVIDIGLLVGSFASARAPLSEQLADCQPRARSRPRRQIQ
jgi:hypothetical protein